MKWHSLLDVLVGQTQRRVVDNVKISFTLTLFQMQSLFLPLSLSLSLCPFPLPHDYHRLDQLCWSEHDDADGELACLKGHGTDAGITASALAAAAEDAELAGVILAARLAKLVAVNDFRLRLVACVRVGVRVLTVPNAHRARHQAEVLAPCSGSHGERLMRRAIRHPDASTAGMRIQACMCMKLSQSICQCVRVYERERERETEREREREREYVS